MLPAQDPFLQENTSFAHVMDILYYCIILLYYSPFIDQGCLAKIIDGWIFGGGKLNLGMLKAFQFLPTLILAQ